MKNAKEEITRLQVYVERLKQQLSTNTNTELKEVLNIDLKKTMAKLAKLQG